MYYSPSGNFNVERFNASTNKRINRSYLLRHLKLSSLALEAIFFCPRSYLVSFPDFSRRLSVSLTTFVDAFIESSLKVFTLPSFPSWYCLHLRKDGQAGFRAFLFGKNACPSMGHSFLPVFRSDGLSYHPDFFVWPGKDIPLFPIVHSFFLYILFFHIFFCTPVSICAKAGALYPMLMCGRLLL